MNTYTFRISMEQVKENSPNENIESLQKVLQTLANYGYTDFSCALSNNIFQKNRELYQEWTAHVKELEEKRQAKLSFDEKYDLQQEFLQDKGKWFFIEGRGLEWFRGEGETYEACAKVILEKYERVLRCKHEEWDYNGEYASKTCLSCQKREDASSGEIREHCEKGKIPMDNGIDLLFDNNHEICPFCKSHEMLRHRTVFPNEQFVCKSCEEIIPLEHAWYDTPHLLKMNMIAKTFEEKIREDYAFDYEAKKTKEELNALLLRFISSIYQHAIKVKKMKNIEDIQSWIQPYIDWFIEDAKMAFENENKEQFQIKKVTISGLQQEQERITFQYALALEQADREYLSNEEQFTKGMTELFTAISKK